jgi:hypothetical protein
VIELPRAYKLDTFKTAGVQVNIGAKGDILVLTEDQRHELMEVNRQRVLALPSDRAEWEAMQEKEAKSHSVTEQGEGVTPSEPPAEPPPSALGLTHPSSGCDGR